MTDEVEKLTGGPQWYQGFFQSVPDPLAIVAIEPGQVLEVNPAFEQFYGYSRAEVIGRTTAELAFWVDPHQRSRLLEELRQNGDVHRFETRVRIKSGQTRWVALTVYPFEAGGRTLHAVFVQDITDRKAHLDLLGRYQALARHSRDVILFIRRRDGLIIEANHAAEVAYGYTREELLSLRIQDLRAPATLAMIGPQMLEADVAEILFETEHRRKDGSLFPVEVSSRGTDMAGERLLLSIIRDITKRRQDEQSQRGSEHRFRRMFDEAPMGMALTDSERRVVKVNAAFSRMLGYDSDEIAGRQLDQFTCPDDLPGDLLFHEWALRDEDSYFEREKRYVARDGQLIPTLVTVAPLAATPSDPQLLLMMVQDLSGHRKIESELRQSQQRLAAMMEAIPDPTWFQDANGRYLAVNAAWCALFGRDAHEALGRKIADFVSPDVAAVIEAENEELRQEGKPLRRDQAVPGPDGRQWWFDTIRSPIINSDGDFVGIVGVARDITAKRLVQQALRESEAEARQATERAAHQSARLEAVLRSMHEGVIVADRAGAITYCNQAFRQFNDCNCEKACRQGCKIDFSLFDLAGRPVAAADRPRMRLFRGQTVINEQYWVETVSGKRFAGRFSGTLVRDAWGEPEMAVVTVGDVTAQWQAQEQARSYEERLRQLAMEASLAEERERRKLSSHLHDEVCQLLTVAQMRLSLIQQSDDIPTMLQLTEQTKSLVHRANVASRSLMLQLSHPALYDLGFAAAAEWLAEDIQRLYGLQVVIWRDHEPAAIDLRLRIMLYQCLRELLVNAAKHAQASAVDVSISGDDAWVRLQVEDHGRGFDPQTIEKADSTSGFGLFSIRERVRSIGGKMTVDSALGEGTRVAIELPCGLASEGKDQE